MPPTRRCTGTTKAGKPCRANPMKDRDVCLAHADEETRGSARFGGPQPGSGRPPAPRAVDLLRERMEADLDQVLGPLWDALVADRAIVVGNGPQAYVENVPDHGVRITAVREMLDRSYGKPKQQTEVTGEIRSGPIMDLSRLSDDELAALEALTAKAAA